MENSGERLALLKPTGAGLLAQNSSHAKIQTNVTIATSMLDDENLTSPFHSQGAVRNTAALTSLDESMTTVNAPKIINGGNTTSKGTAQHHYPSG